MASLAETEKKPHNKLSRQGYTSPDLKAPTVFVFRGFAPDSYTGDKNWYQTLIPARIKKEAGFIRAVDYQISNVATHIGLRQAKTEDGEIPGAFNGVIQAYKHDDILALSEHGHNIHAYNCFIPTPKEHFEPLSWLALPLHASQIWVQISHPDRIANPNVDRPLLQTYLDQQLARMRNIGGNDDMFAREFVDTTRNWPIYWLNDREIPRRPWVHIEKANPKESGSTQLRYNDGILRSHPSPPYNTFALRKLSVEYSILVAAVKHGIDSNSNNNSTINVMDTKERPKQLNQTRDWTGQKLKSASIKHFMFGFGSLMNTKSRTTSDPTAISVVPVRISSDVGYSRAWNFQHPTAKITALGLKKCETGEIACTINGVCSPIITNTGNDAGGEATLPKEILEREVGYTPVSIPSKFCKPLSYARLPENSRVWMFVPDGPVGKPGVNLKMASHSHPILQTYVDICILGCLEFSKEFAIEFIHTTIGWDSPWLNDREVPRRPWIHQPQFRLIDDLLAEEIPEQFSKRMLPEEFGAKLIVLEEEEKRLRDSIDKNHLNTGTGGHEHTSEEAHSNEIYY